MPMTTLLKHYGPGPHPGTGSDQAVHGGDAVHGKGSLLYHARISGKDLGDTDKPIHLGSLKQANAIVRRYKDWGGYNPARYDSWVPHDAAYFKARVLKPSINSIDTPVSDDIANLIAGWYTTNTETGDPHYYWHGITDRPLLEEVLRALRTSAGGDYTKVVRTSAETFIRVTDPTTFDRISVTSQHEFAEADAAVLRYVIDNGFDGGIWYHNDRESPDFPKSSTERLSIVVPDSTHLSWERLRATNRHNRYEWPDFDEADLEPAIFKHYGPVHPGTHTDQQVHGGGSSGGSLRLPFPDGSETSQPVPALQRFAREWGLPELPEGATHWMLAADLPLLAGKIDALNRKAQKFGVEPLGFEIIGDEVVGTKVQPSGDYVSLSFAAVRITGEAPKMPGNSRLIARIEHLMMEDGTMGNLLITAPSNTVVIPEEFRNRGPVCDLCKRSIYRRDTYLVLNDVDGWVQLGRDDLQAYTGYPDPRDLIQQYRLYDEISSFMGDYYDDDPETGGRRGAGVMPGAETTALAAMLIRLNGYRRTRQDEWSLDDDPLSTKQVVLDLALHRLSAEGRRRLDQQVLIEDISPQDRLTANAAREWIRGLSEEDLDNNFLWNLHTAAKMSDYTETQIGLVAYLPVAFAKELNSHRERLALTAGFLPIPEGESAYLGTPTGKINLDDVVVTWVYQHEGYQEGSTATAYKFVDRHGRVLVWWKSSGSASITDDNGNWRTLQVGDRVSITGAKVKSHGVYQEEPQTTVTNIRETSIAYRGQGQAETLSPVGVTYTNDRYPGVTLTSIDLDAYQALGVSMSDWTSSVSKHLGPGDHPSGSPQDVHAGDYPGRTSESPVPQEPGTAPIPEGYVRLYHYTKPGMIDRIGEHGILLSEAIGESYGEQNLVWASTTVPRTDREFVEFAVPLSFLKPFGREGGAAAVGAIHDNMTVETFQAGGHNIGFAQDIPPEFFVAIHRPWHGGYRYLTSHDMRAEVLDGSYDNIADDPRYGDAIRRIKAEASKLLSPMTSEHEEILAEIKQERADRKARRVALSLGEVAPGEDDDIGAGDWEALPETLYHTTTAASAVQLTGLKTREELGQEKGAGLGGGSDETISFTTDPDVAESIKDSILEARRVSRGEFTVEDMIAIADRDGYLDGILRYYRQYPYPNKDDGLPTWFQYRQKGLEADVTTLPKTEDQYNKQRGDGGVRWRGVPGKWPEGHYDTFVRPLSSQKRREQDWDFYTIFAPMREHSGGPSYPLFWLSDFEGLAKIDPEQVRVLKLRPKPGAMGYMMSALGEWRTHTGKAVELEEVL